MMKAAFLCVFWQWALAFLISLCSLVIPIQRLQWSIEVPLYTLFALAPVTLAALWPITLGQPTTSTE
jgi:hypothetical protein